MGKFLRRLEEEGAVGETEEAEDPVDICVNLEEDPDGIQIGHQAGNGDNNGVEDHNGDGVRNGEDGIIHGIIPT